MLLSILLVFFNFVKVLTLDFIGVMLRLFQTLGIFNDNLHLISAYHVYLENLYLMEKNKEVSFSEDYIVNSELDEKNSIVISDVSFKYFNSDEYILPHFDLTSSAASGFFFCGIIDDPVHKLSGNFKNS